MKPTLIIALLALSFTPAIAAHPASSPTADPNTWTGSIDAAQYAPCKAWRRNPDGSWTYPGTMNIRGAEITNITIGGHGEEAMILEQRCAAIKK